jgi:hypothetical protein
VDVRDRWRAVMREVREEFGFPTGPEPTTGFLDYIDDDELEGAIRAFLEEKDAWRRNPLAKPFPIEIMLAPVRDLLVRAGKKMAEFN